MSILIWLMRKILCLVFRIEVRGLEHYPKTGNRLVIANHTSWIDAALISCALPEVPVFAIDTKVAKLPLIKALVKLIRFYPIDPLNPLYLKTLCEVAKTGTPVVIFPEGRLSTTGGLMKIYDGAGFIAGESEAEIVPIYIDGAQLSIFTRLHSKFCTQWFPKITITISAPQKLPSNSSREQRNLFIYQLLNTSACSAQIPPHTLFQCLLRAAKQNAGHTMVKDPITDVGLTYTQLIFRSKCLASMLHKRATDKTKPVGLLLPTSLGATLAFWAIQYNHRIACWLNFTMGIDAFRSTLHTAGVKTVVTSRVFVATAKLESLIEALTDVEVLYLEDFQPKFWTKLSFLLLKFNGYRETEGEFNQPSTILFTSGTSGLPKAVVLSHRNIIANAVQVRTCMDLTHNDTVFNCLPLFHAFGLTSGLIGPLLAGVRVLLYPTPLHYGVIPELIYSNNATILFATNSFLQGYARKANDYDFYSLRYVFAGAEKLQAATQKLWLERFGIRIFEGYGTTEAAPGISMNTALYYKNNTVGRLLPNIETRLDPVPGIVDGGRLWIRGPNRMLGYYLPTQPEVLVETDPWYDTGDIVNIDSSGFLSILGRAKRFAKIAGEMISLPAIEDALSHLDTCIVVARPHPTKGEELVLFSVKTLSPADIKASIQAKGLSDLMVPKQLRVLPELPLLGSGKPDLCAIQNLANQ